MKKIIILLLIGLSSITYSQTKTHIVEIKKFEVLDSLNFSIAKVIDNRYYKENIGMAQKGAFNKKVLAVLPGSLPTYLLPILQQIGPKKTENKTFDLVVHDLSVSEQTTAVKETGYCKLQVEFVKDSLSFGLYNAFIQNNGMDVTASHGKRIAKAFASCFLEFNLDVSTLEGEAYHPNLSAVYSFPEKLKKGTYASYSAMLKNEPDTSKVYTLKKTGSKKLEQYVLKDVNGKTYKKRELTYSDGENIYLHSSSYGFENHYIKTKQTGRYLYFEDRYSNPAMATGLAIGFGLAGGLVGALASNTKHGIVLDTKTGVVTVLSENSIKDLLKDHPALYKKYESTNKKIVMKEVVIMELNRLFEKNS